MQKEKPKLLLLGVLKVNSRRLFSLRMKPLQVKWSENGLLALLYIRSARAFTTFANLVIDGIAFI